MNVKTIVPALAMAAGLAFIPSAANASPVIESANGHGSTHVAILRGANEVAGGDQDGVAVAVFHVSSDSTQVCYLLAQANLDGTVAAAHIHKGAAGANGPVVVPLMAPVNGFVHACTTVAAALGADIAANPANYYANIHTSAFPGGAVRGQLR